MVSCNATLGLERDRGGSPLSLNAQPKAERLQKVRIAPVRREIHRSRGADEGETRDRWRGEFDARLNSDRVVAHIGPLESGPGE